MQKKVLIGLLVLFPFVACNTRQDNQQEDAVIVKDEVERTGDELKIVAIITVKPEQIRDMLPLFQEIVQGSQEEDGCISYNLHQDIKDSTKFIMLEEWKSQDAINYHNNTDHFKSFKAASKDMVEKSEVSVMKLIY